MRELFNLRIIVCGGRAFSDRKRLHDALDRVHEMRRIELLAHGACRGADTLGEDWAKRREVCYFGYPARWGSHQAAAGPIRNRDLLRIVEPDLVIACSGGAGTADMTELCQSKGIRVMTLGSGETLSRAELLEL